MASEPLDGSEPEEAVCPAFRALLEAIPSPAFIVDDDVRLLLWNASGAELAEAGTQLYKRRGGEALNCINADNPFGGCGHSEACQECVVRGAVGDAFRRTLLGQRRTRVEVRRGEKVIELYLRVTASPISVNGRMRVLLILEDISELIRLQSLLPICAWCGRVRTPESYWQSLSEYISSRADIDFTHSICSDCYDRVLPSFSQGSHRQPGARQDPPA
jgi:hypothetical protein